MNNPTLIKRLTRELKIVTQDPPANCTAGPKNDNDLTEWEAIIFGPDGTPFTGGIFRLFIKFTDEYPIKPPKIKFLTSIFHPNIDRNGNICLDILKENWTPALTISNVLLSICSLLGDPNPNDPLEKDIALMYINDKQKYLALAQNYTMKFATKIE